LKIKATEACRWDAVSLGEVMLRLDPGAGRIRIDQSYDILAAGQTVPHLHIHLIPRYSGDKQDPRGGVRWIIPDKADYWSKR
jgi:diadenosine tetraphosphate (Ap4A) HIT family hydrolase